MSVVFISRDDPRHAALAAAAERQADIIRFATGRALGGGMSSAPPAYRDVILDHAGAFLDARGDALAARLSGSAAALAFKLPDDWHLEAANLPDPPAPSGFVVIVTLGTDTVLSVGGEGVLQAQLPPAEHQALVAGLIETLRVVTAAGPKRLVTSEAAEALDGLTAGLNPSDAEAADAALAVPIVARCQVLIDAAKARLAL